MVTAGDDPSLKGYEAAGTLTMEGLWRCASLAPLSVSLGERWLCRPQPSPPRSTGQYEEDSGHTMSIRTNASMEELDDEGEEEMVLVAVTYTGDRSMYAAQPMRSQGNYPALDGFQNGETKLVRLPSSSLGWWENHADFELAYDPEAIAEMLLGKNYLPEQIIGPDFNPKLRDVVHDKLGIEPQANEESYRQVLREIVADDEDGGGGEDDDEAVPEHTHQQRVDSLVERDRSVLIKAANSYEDVDELKDEEEVNSVSHLNQQTLAEFLADKPDDEVNRKLDRAEMGAEL